MGQAIVGKIAVTEAPLPTVSHLRNILSYRPDTGLLFWRDRPLSMFSDGLKSAAAARSAWNGRWAGAEAFTAINKGYRVGAIKKKMLTGHRVAWAIYSGEWPNGEIDHVNHNRVDNRIANLRLCCGAENSRNQSLMTSNTSGVCGVSWHKAASKWRAQIQDNGRQVHLGLFDLKSEAVAARRAASAKFGYHPNHGEAGTWVNWT